MLTINSAIIDTGAFSTLNKTGTGTLVLAGSNLYTGRTSVLGGTLKLGKPGALVATSPLSVVSNATFVQDNAITQDQQGLDFISGSVNWLLSREQLIGIAPKVSKPLTFSLDQDALSRLRWIILIFMPLIPAVIGTVVWWQRRV